MDIRKALHSLIHVRKVWRNIKRKNIPGGYCCIKSKWVFDGKVTELFKVRLVACGYSQIPGVNLTELYAPVSNDVSWRVLLILKMIKKYHVMIVDMETAFLYGDLNEEVYIICREVHEEDKALHLLHSIYGLVQAARQYFIKFKNKL